MKFEYTKHNHAVGDNFHHLQWCTKYRYDMFTKFKYKNLAEACIRKACKRYNIQIIALSVKYVEILTFCKSRVNNEMAIQYLLV